MKFLLQIFIFLLVVVNLHSEVEIKPEIIKDINIQEGRINDLNNELYKLMYEEETLNTSIESLKIPPFLSGDIGCSGITADFGDVYDVLMEGFKNMVSNVPQWILQETLGIPDFNSPGAMITWASEQIIQGYCVMEVGGIQAVQTASEGSLDYIQRKMETAEYETENGQGTSLIHNAIPHTYHGHEKEMTSSTNENASQKSKNETTSEGAKEIYEKLALCVKDKKRFVSSVMDMKVKKFTPLSNDKSKMMKSACEIIAEKGKKTDLNDKLNIPNELYSPIFWKSTSKEELLELDVGLIYLRKNSENSKIQHFLKDDKIKKFFENDSVLKEYETNTNNLKNSDMVKNSLYVINTLTKCLNNPDESVCKELSLNNDFMLNFDKDPNELNGLQNILIRKKNICNAFESLKYENNYIVEEQIKLLLNTYAGFNPNNALNVKEILNFYILDNFCGVNFSKEINELESLLSEKIFTEIKSITKDYSLVLSELKSFKHLNSFFLKKEGSTNLKNMKGVCAYMENKDKISNIKIFYMDENGIVKSKEGDNAKNQLESYYDVEIENKPTKIPIIGKKINNQLICDYDINSQIFKDMYENYLDGISKQSQTSKPLSKDEWKEQVYKDRQNELVDYNRMNGLGADLRTSLINILTKTKNNIIIKLKF